MLEANVPLVLERIGPNDRVLDVGGWARCFNRADHVLDKFPYETRGARYADALGLNAQGGEVERFSAATWACRDLCAREPWPYPDGCFDFCTCSHTLEDLRDPLWVCSEMQRVARRGYIEVPSARFELTRGREPLVPVGLSHHLWVVELREPQTLVFHPKTHNLHGNPSLSLPASYGASLAPEQLVTWIFWDRTIDAKEGWLHPEVVREWVRSWCPDAPAADSPVDPGLERRVLQAETAVGDLRAQLWEAREQLAWERHQHEETRAALLDLDRRLAAEHHLRLAAEALRRPA
jgi:hypothetical protein